MDAVREKATGNFEDTLACELPECGSISGRRYKTPMGIRCEWCLGKVLTSALENGGRLWTCTCKTNAQPCGLYRGKELNRWGIVVCQNSPCHHLPGCHHDGVRNGTPVAIWMAGLRAAA